MRKKSYDIQELWSQIVEKSDPKAFECLFYALNPRLIKFCLFYVHSKEVAEELVSDIFVKCWKRKSELLHVKNIETYLFIAAKNQALNYVKRFSSIHLVAIDESSMQLVDMYRPDREMEKRELLFKLDQAIESLPRQCRIIFRLVKDEGMKYKEVAEILGISQRTVQTQLFRAMKKLNTEMTPYLKSTEIDSVINLTLTILFAFTLFVS